MGEAGEVKRLSRWYFGGLASAGAACCTHPLDLIKVERLMVRIQHFLIVELILIIWIQILMKMLYNSSYNRIPELGRQIIKTRSIFFNLMDPNPLQVSPTYLIYLFALVRF